jgi:hypothetical protein
VRLRRTIGILLLCLAGCAGPTQFTSCTGGTGFPPVDCHRWEAHPPSALVLVADGAGNFQEASRSLRQTAQQEGLPLAIQTFEWSHGRFRILADHVDRQHLLCQGQQLAQVVACQRQRDPHRPIHLVGHSAGADVVLIATEHLPPGSIDRVVLLAPAVSCCHDLRPALRCARQGVDVFYSERDTAYLGLLVGVLGTTDRYRSPAAGRVGFHPCFQCPEDPVLFSKLRQHPWHPCLSWTGNRGGHFGAYQPCFLRFFVFPLLVPGNGER